MFLDIINNIALIVALSLLYSLISRRWKHASASHQAATGIVFGLIAIAGMMIPVAYAPGIIFDGRSIIISTAGFIAGPLAAGIAAMLSAAYRYRLGGGGAVMGVAVITASALIGSAYYYLRRRNPVLNKPLYLYGFGIVVHLCMLALTMTLPPAVRFATLNTIALPVMLIYPVGTVLVCLFLLNQEKGIHAEELLRESEKRYRELVENANSIIVRWTGSGSIAFINEFGLKFFGYAESELPGKKLVGTIVPETETTGRDPDRLMKDICARPEDFHHTVTETMRGNGELVWVAWTNKILYDKQGHVDYILSIGSDITDRMQAEDALRESENAVRNKLKALTEPEGDIGVLTLSDIIDAPSLQAMMDDFYRLTGLLCAILDVEGTILVAAGWQDICTRFHRCHPETLKNCVESDTILSSGVPEGTFKTYRCKNNLRDMVTPIMVGGRHLGNFFIGQFFYDDEKPDVELFRRQARRYGFDEADYLAAFDRVPRLSRETAAAAMAFYAKLAAMIASLSYSTVRLSRALAEGRQAEAALREMNLTLEDRVAIRTEELRVAMEQAQDADRLKSAFLATMSHELRTPLNSIIGFTGILLQSLAGPLNEEQTKQMHMIRESARHLLALINDVLDISKIEAGQLEIVKETFDIRQTVEEVLQVIMPLAAKKGLSVSAAIDASVGSMVSDQRRVKQILLNLVSNAVKFTSQGEVHIACLIHEGLLEICVRDTGIGIAPQDRDQLFQSFRQIESGLTRTHDGTGLGLSICKKLVEMLGGSIEVESEPGVGSAFMFTLPQN